MKCRPSFALLILIAKQDFEKLDLAGRVAHLNQNGTFITSRDERGMEIFLFSYNNFFVEVWKKAGSQKIYWIRTRGTEIADFYVDAIDFSALFPVS